LVMERFRNFRIVLYFIILFIGLESLSGCLWMEVGMKTVVSRAVLLVDIADVVLV
jgi:hypothetical protein